MHRSRMIEQHKVGTFPGCKEFRMSYWNWGYNGPERCRYKPHLRLSNIAQVGKLDYHKGCDRKWIDFHHYQGLYHLMAHTPLSQNFDLIDSPKLVHHYRLGNRMMHHLILTGPFHDLPNTIPSHLSQLRKYDLSPQILPRTLYH